MRLENPVANVDHVDVLFDDDVARKNTIIDPIAQAMLGGRRIWPCGPIDVAGEVISLTADNLANGAIMDATNHLHEWGAIPNLEADIKAELTLRPFADLDHFQCPRNINRDRFFKIDVLACVYHRL